MRLRSSPWLRAAPAGARIDRFSQAGRANGSLKQHSRVELQAARRRMSVRYRALSSGDQRLAELVRYTRKAPVVAGASGLADKIMRDMAAPTYEGLVRWLQERS